MKELELLAPAGSYEGILASFAAGADAVYTGGMMFSARAFAKNCDEDRLLDAIDYAHVRGKKLYVTINTLLKEKECRELLIEYVRPMYERGLDAVIVQDFGVMKLIHEHFPDLAIHASTQMTITTPEAARWLKEEYGVTRVVVPRELSLEEIQAIYDETGMEIEAFVHGALCYCYSGQCLMSSMIGGRSGNRGRCAQPCRLNYSFSGTPDGNGKNKPLLLSPKDLCAVNGLPEIANAGVMSFKIEGRMKKPEYTAGVVRIYRKMLDRYMGQPDAKNLRISDQDYRELLMLFSRNGFTEGYFHKHNGPDMMMLTEKTAHEENQELLRTLREQYVDCATDHARLPVEMDLVVIEPGKNVELTLQVANCRTSFPHDQQSIQKQDRIYTHKVTVTSSIAVSEAINKPVSAEGIASKLKRFGETDFALIKEPSVQVRGNAFIPVSEINQMRQRACELLREEILADYRRESRDTIDLSKPLESASKKKKTLTLRVLVSKREQLAAALLYEEVTDLIIGESFYDFWNRPKLREEIARSIHDAGKRCILEMPRIFRDEARIYFEANQDLLDVGMIDGYLIHSVDEVFYLSQCRKDGFLSIYDASVYSMNHYASEVLAKLGGDVLTLPYELNRRELRELLKEDLQGNTEREMIIYGRVPMMVSAQCLLKNTAGCKKGTENHFTLTDRMKEQMPVYPVCRYCYNVIYNARVLNLAMEGIAEEFGCTLRANFLDENGDFVTKYLQKVVSGQAMDEADPNYYTKGHFKRGVD